MKKLAFLLIISLLISSPLFSQNNTYLAEKGILDLRNYDFMEDGSIKLDGEWKFYWKSLLTPEQLNDSTDKKFIFVNNPIYWNDLDFHGEKITGTGFGTFELTVLVDSKKNNFLALDIREIMTSYKLWINGELISENGIVAENSEDASPNFTPMIKNVLITIDTLKIVIQEANFSHINGGMFATPKIGNYEKIARQRERGIAYDLFLFGAIMIISIYHFGLYIIRRKRTSALYFGILTLLVALRTIVTGTEFFSILFQNVSWQVTYRIEYITFFCSPPAFLAFLYFNFKEEVNKWVLFILTGVAVLASLTLFLPSMIFTQLATPYQLITLGLIIYTIYFLFLALKRKREGALILTITLVLFFVTVVNDVLYAQGIADTTELLPLGVFIFILGQSLLLAIKFNMAFTKNEELTETLDYQNKNLEKIVTERTREIENQKSEIMEKNEELLQQNEEIVAQRDEIEKFNIELEKLSIVASKTDNAVIICDKNGDFEWVNEGFTRLYGYDLEQLIEKFGNNIIQSSSNPQTKELFEQCITEKKSVIYESQTQTFKGETIWVQTTITPIIDAQDNIVNLIAIESDIRKLKDAEIKITNQKELLEFQHSMIKSSINYASTIQRAILPTAENISSKFDNFIIFKPKDVVSGDFYWYNSIDNGKLIIENVKRTDLNSTLSINNSQLSISFIAVVDCTGHGVSGAFMSMIGSRLLSEIINERHIFEPNQILENLDSGIKHSLHQPETSNTDGMDVCLCRIQKTSAQNFEISFAGAKRNLIFYQNSKNKLETIRGTRRSIGGLSSHRNKLEFETVKFSAEKSDILYLSTDGFTDQSNIERKKMGTAYLTTILEEIKDKTMIEQKMILEEILSKWMQGSDQRDDITFVGIKL